MYYIRTLLCTSHPPPSLRQQVQGNISAPTHLSSLTALLSVEMGLVELDLEGVCGVAVVLVVVVVRCDVMW